MITTDGPRGPRRQVARGVAQLAALAASQWDAAVTTPLVAAQQAVRAIGSDIAIVDEAIATSLHVRSFLNSASARQCSFPCGGGLGWGMPTEIPSTTAATC